MKLGASKVKGAPAPFRRSQPASVLEVDLGPKDDFVRKPKKSAPSPRVPDVAPVSPRHSGALVVSGDEGSRPPKSVRKLSRELEKEDPKGRKRRPSEDDESPSDKKSSYPVARRLPSQVSAEVSEDDIRTMFGQRADVILDMLETTDSDGTLTLMRRTLLQMMVSLLPTIEDSVRRSRGNRNVHGLNMCVSQLRELMADIQAAQDRGMLGEQIVEKILRPTMLDISVQIRNAVELVASGFRGSCTDAQYQSVYHSSVIPVLRELSSYLTQAYENTRESVSRSLT